MTQRVLLGMLTPSSNTVLEPVTSAMVQGLPGVSAHFSRFTVTQIALSDNALGQFSIDNIIAAAKLLADANVDVIAWSGTAAGWLGFDTDKRLCREITAATGIPATTSVLALNEILDRTGADEFGLVSPYTADVQDRIVENYKQAGFACVAERHLDLDVNFSFSEVTEQQLTEMVCDVAINKPKAITTFCTNLRAAHLAHGLEQKTGIPLYDSIATAVWSSLRQVGFDTRKVTGWGSLFQNVF